MDKKDDILKKPLYVFDLPHEILSTLQPDGKSTLTSLDQEQSPHAEVKSNKPTVTEQSAGTKTCSTCGTSFQDVMEQRQHVRSDWHRYNLKQKLRGQTPVDEATFDRLIGELDESISGSDSESSEEEVSGGAGEGRMLSQLLKKQAKINESNTKADLGSESAPAPRKGSPFIWFMSPKLPPEHHIGIYRALFSKEDQQKSNLATCLTEKQLEPKDARQLAKDKGEDGIPSSTEPQIFLCMIGGGHFAGMIVSLTPKLEKKAHGVTERQAIVVVHKTFHRYTTRRKQGGAQSANDAAKGAAHSAGAGIRRANEAALQMEVRSLLEEWAPLLQKCELLFIRATGITNRRTLFGPYEKQVINSRDPRIRSFPFTTRRATQSELMRAFVELTRAKVEAIPEEPVKPEAVESKAKPAAVQKVTVAKPSKEEEEALLHTSQLQALIRRSKAPALLKYLSSNNLSPDFRFHPSSTIANRHASTPLHLASSGNSPIIVSTLLVKAGADPTALNGEEKVPFEIAGDRATRDAFRIARSELGEGRWDWEKAHCPPAISREEAEAREKAQQAEVQIQEEQRRKAELARIEQERQSANGTHGARGKKIPALEATAADRREQEARGLTPEQKQRLERERRARAAEERMRRMAGGQS